MKPTLKNVACVQIEALFPDRAARVLNWCAECCDFGDVILFSPTPPNVEFRGRWVQIPKFSYVGYSTFSVKCLAHYVKSEYALVTQHDGFILHPKNWRDDFMHYDYIGAPWPVTMGPDRVGNSGFSLRSQAFLRACAEAPIPHNNENDAPDARRYAPGVDEAADDIWMCKNPLVRAWMKESGIEYAPFKVAKYFSSELEVEGVPYDDSMVFGFHDFSPVHREAYKDLVGWTPYQPPEAPLPSSPPVTATLCPSCVRHGRKTVSKWGK